MLVAYVSTTHHKGSWLVRAVTAEEQRALEQG